MIVAIFDRNVSIFADHPPNWSAAHCKHLRGLQACISCCCCSFFKWTTHHTATLLILIKTRAVCLWAPRVCRAHVDYRTFYYSSGRRVVGGGALKFGPIMAVHFWHVDESFTVGWWPMAGWGFPQRTLNANDNDNWSDLNANNGGKRTHAFAVGCHEQVMWGGAHVTYWVHARKRLKLLSSSWVAGQNCEKYNFWMVKD